MSKKTKKIEETKASVGLPQPEDQVTPLMVYGTDASDKKRAKIAEIRASTGMRRNCS